MIKDGNHIGLANQVWEGMILHFGRSPPREADKRSPTLFLEHHQGREVQSPSAKPKPNHTCVQKKGSFSSRSPLLRGPLGLASWPAPLAPIDSISPLEKAGRDGPKSNDHAPTNANRNGQKKQVWPF
mgnify:CR=1 FL=1